MNFLAHLYLSGDSEGLRIGNFIGDYVKGRKHHDYPTEIQNGILLHRRIDTFTDQHPITRGHKKYFSKKFSRYSGVVVDLLYDHFLAARWNDLSAGESLHTFVHKIYDILLRHYYQIPSRVQGFLPYFVLFNWLENYAYLSGIKRAIQRLGSRTAIPQEQDYLEDIVNPHYEKIYNEFLEFFYEVCRMVEVQEIGVNLTPKMKFPGL